MIRGRCPSCGTPTELCRMVPIRIVEVSDDGHVTFPLRKACGTCIGACGMLMTDRAGRELAQQMLARMGAAPTNQEELKHV